MPQPACGDFSGIGRGCKKRSPRRGGGIEYVERTADEDSGMRFACERSDANDAARRYFDHAHGILPAAMKNFVRKVSVRAWMYYHGFRTTER